MILFETSQLVGRRASPPVGNRATDPLSQLRRALVGRRVLVVEDEFLTADDIALVFARLAVEYIGPAQSLQRAMELLESCGRLDGAVLDINMQGEMVFPLADALRKRGVPFVFATGYNPDVIPERYRDVPICLKPIDSLKLVQALFLDSVGNPGSPTK
jgi:DNA-binding LytR/AlgR family response regulator